MAKEEDNDESAKDGAGPDEREAGWPAGTPAPEADSSGDEAPATPSTPLDISSSPSSSPSTSPSSAAIPPDAMPGKLTRKERRRKRVHPYATELTMPAETKFSAGQVTFFWLAVATLMLIVGDQLQARFGYFGADDALHPDWEAWTLVPLFAGIALLGFGLNRSQWTKRVTMIGWLLFAFYWALTARDLYIREGADFVNMVFAWVGVYFFTYLAYHNWLSLARNVDNKAVHFLNVSTFVAAGAYFLIDKIQPVRLWLIHLVSDHTKWMLDLFRQGDKAGLQFVVDEADNKSPTTFFYPDQYCSPFRPDPETGTNDAVGQYCASLPPGEQHVATYLAEPNNWFEWLLRYTPDGDTQVLPVSIILACTALQSIMLFVGLFAGTEAAWQRKVKVSIVVAAIVYVLNLVRNTGIIWFYGQGHASFWVMHNAIGKGGSLIAMIAIAFGVFRWFPEFFNALVSVLDLPERDGPIERTLRLGRKRPEPAAANSPPGPPTPPLQP